MGMVAIITARGGSKRIPHKNIKEFCGKPIIEYSIQAALISNLFDEVMVSTDDEKIATIARNAGANVPFMRSKQNANDYATSADVLIEVLNEYEKRNRHFEWVCCIYPTAPFITADKLNAAWQQVIENKANGITPVVRYSFPPQRSFGIEQGYLKFNWSEYKNFRSQDLEPFYHDAGQFYFLKSSLLEQERSLLVPQMIPFELSELEVQDIDNDSDWKIAEFKYRIMMGKIE